MSTWSNIDVVPEAEETDMRRTTIIHTASGVLADRVAKAPTGRIATASPKGDKITYDRAQTGDGSVG